MSVLSSSLRILPSIKLKERVPSLIHNCLTNLGNCGRSDVKVTALPHPNTERRGWAVFVEYARKFSTRSTLILEMAPDAKTCHLPALLNALHFSAEPVELVAVDKVWEDRLTEYLNTRGQVRADKPHHRDWTEFQLRETKGTASMQPLTLPKDYLWSRLTESDAALVNSKWNYPNGNDNFTAFKIRNFPSVCIRTRDGELAAWALTAATGIAEHHYTMENHRGFGLGALTSCAMAGELLRHELQPIAYISDTNEQAKRANKMGVPTGRRVCFRSLYPVGSET